MARRLRAVLVVDVVDSVRLIQQYAEGTIQRWRDFVTDVTREELPPRGGRLVKQLGNGMVLEFESALDAVECAIAMQSRIERCEASQSPERRASARQSLREVGFTNL